MLLISPFVFSRCPALCTKFNARSRSAGTEVERQFQVIAAVKLTVQLPLAGQQYTAFNFAVNKKRTLNLGPK